MTSLTTSGLGIRRRDLQTTRWYFYCPNSLLVRFEKLITSRATHKAVYGLRSSVLTELLQAWLASPERTSFAQRAKGWKRPKHDAHDNNTRVSVYLPRELAAQIEVNFTSPSGGPLFGFQTFLLANLLKEWVEEREAHLAKGLPSHDLRS